MRCVRFIALTVALAGLAGCIDVETVVHVRPDGSGYVEERMLMREDAVAMLGEMSAAMGDEGDAGSVEARLVDEAKLRERARSMGEGVALLAAEPISTEAGAGYRARFAFEDINALRIDQNPGDKAPGASAGAVPGPEPKRELVTFDFRPGPTPELVIHAPRGGGMDEGDGAGENTPGAEPTDPDSPEGQMATQMMRKLFDGLRVALALEVEGRIVESNATHRTDSRVTLMDLDFGRLLRDAKRLESFAARQPESIAEAKDLMRAIPGMKLELEPEVRIRFAPAVAASNGPARTAQRNVPYRWREVDLAELPRQRGKLIRITDAEGATHKGMLQRAGAARVVLRRARMDGGGTVDMASRDIAELEVLEPRP